MSKFLHKVLDAMFPPYREKINRGQGTSELTVVYENLLTSLENQRDVLYKDISEQQGWVATIPDRRHLRHLEEELDSIDRDISSVLRSRRRVAEDSSSGTTKP